VLKLLAESERMQAVNPAIDALGGFDAVLTRGTSVLQASLSATFGGEEGTYRVRRPDQDFEHSKNYSPPSLTRAWISQCSSFLKATTVHDLSVAALRMPAVIQQQARLGPDGMDAAAVLDVLAGEQPALRDAIDEAVRQSAQEVRRVVTRPGPEPGTKILGVEEKDGRIYGADDMSDGLLLFIGLAIAAQLKANTPCILAIEEPERGIHPRRLRDLVDHLLRLTRSGVQVVLTTHSPTLLDEFRDSPESVLIFDRDERGTHITRLSDRPEWAKELKGAPLGELWYSGVLGGVPGR
jgi:predicted ATPase